VLLAASRSALEPYGGAIRKIMDLRTTKDSNIGTAAPRNAPRQRIVVWMSEPAG
jgi:hypothetical protein